MKNFLKTCSNNPALPYFIFFSFILLIALVDNGQVHPDTVQVWTPQGIYGDHWDSAQFEPFTGNRITWPYILLITAYLGLTNLLGFLLLRPMKVDPDTSAIVRIGSGFIIGFIAVTGLNRIVTLFFPHRFAPGICFFVLTATTGLLFFLGKKEPVPIQLSDQTVPGTNKSSAKSLKKKKDEKNKKAPKQPRPVYRWIFAIASVAVIYLVFLVWQVQFGRFYMVGDSTTAFFLPFLSKTLASIDPTAFFPLVDQQYDEIIYSYPLHFTSLGSSIFIIPFWCLSSLGKPSLLFLLALLMTPTHCGKSGRILGLAAATFLVMGTDIANPFKMIELHGGNNPILYGGHIGRYFGVVIPLLVVRLFFEETSFSPLLAATATLLGIGLGTTSVHNLLFSFSIGILCIIFRTVKGLPLDAVFRAKTMTWGLLGLVLAPILTYAFCLPSHDYFQGKLLFAATVFGLLLLVFNLKGDFKTAPERTLGQRLKLNLNPGVYLFLAGGIFSFLFLGNVIATRMTALLESVPLVADHLPAAFSEPFLARTALDTHVTPEPFQFTGFRTPSLHAAGFSYFLGYYGLFVLIATAVILILKSRENSKVPDPEIPFIQEIVTFFLLLFSLAFFYCDFVVDGTKVPWVKYRLLEVPFYSIFLIFFLLINKYFSSKQQNIIACLAAFWTVLPMFSNHLLQQWIANLGYLLGR